MKRWCIFLICIIASVTIWSQHITLVEAETTAKEILTAESVSVIKVAEHYCVFQANKKKGFAVVSLEVNAKRRVLGFSQESSWKEESFPPALKDWLCRLDSIQHEINADYTKFDSDETIGAERNKSISPLLTCHWHQRSPYNDLAPVIKDGNVKTVAGCVAIAAAQITYYWRKDNPIATLRDTPTYIYSGAPVEYVVVKGSSNNWELIKDSYTNNDSPESRAAAAQLCYVLGTTSYLNYAASTGGHINTAASAMYSQYELLSDYTTKTSVTQKEWEKLLFNELVAGRPIMCSGSGNGGHAFVCDGYDRNTKLYHFNFGWGGDGDGYYPVDDSSAAMGGYNEDQTVVYKIHPQKRNVNADIILQNNVVNPEKKEFVLKIKNLGTLPIYEPKLYVLHQGEETPTDDSYVWKGDTIQNDSLEYSIVFDEGDLPEGDAYSLLLTDEYHSKLLYKNMSDIASGLNSVDENSVNAGYVIYDLQGKPITKPGKGIYIKRSGNKTQKIVL